MDAITSVGLGLRRDFIEAFLGATHHPDFIEVAPENWMSFGGRHAKLLAQFRKISINLSRTLFVDWWSSSLKY